MPRSMWTGAISFGLVNVPVKLFTAARSKDIGFNQLHEADGARIQMKRVCSEDGQEVPFSEIVKGYEVSPDHYVMITPEELDALAPEVTKGIEIEEFVDLVDIDPIYYESSYYLAPDKSGVKAYGLLVKAMQEAGKVAIGRVVLRSKQYVVALRPSGNALCMSTLYFSDEVVSQDSLDNVPQDLSFDKRELAMAQQLIGALSEKFDPEKYHDDYREKVLDLIERKSEGEEIVLQPRTEPKPKVVDLMAALEASIAAAKGGGKKAVAAEEEAEDEKEPVAVGARASRKAPAKAASKDDEEAKPGKRPARAKKSA
jgi:DNA end-binding protein Ku